MTTKAKTAKGLKLAVKIDGVKTYFNEVKAVPAIGESPSKVDATHLTSDSHEYIKDIPDYSADLTFTMNAQPYVGGGTAAVSNLNLIEQLDKNGAYEFIVEYPSLNQIVTIVGDWSYSMGAGAVSSIMEIEFTIIPRTAPVFSAYGVTNVTLSFSPVSDSGEGTGTMEAETVAVNTSVSIPASTFTAPEGKMIGSWNTQANAEGTSYNLNDSILMDQSYTLYAIWVEDNSNQ